MHYTQMTPGQWRAQFGNCGKLLAVMSDAGPVAMLGLAPALNPYNVAAIIATPDLVAAARQAEQLIFDLQMMHRALDDADTQLEICDALDALRKALAKTENITALAG
jgi:hypothetical protein